MRIPDPATFERAYADVLISHIDRLGDPCPEADPLERIATSMLEAFEAVSALDPTFTRFEKDRAALKGKLWPVPGQVLWLPQGSTLQEHANSRIPVTVQLTFQGKDGDTLCIVEIKEDERHFYRIVCARALAPAETAPTFFQTLVTTDKDEAMNFLKRAGIVDADGKLAEPYRE